MNFFVCWRNMPWPWTLKPPDLWRCDDVKMRREVKTCCSFDSYGADLFCTGEPNNKLLEVPFASICEIKCETLWNHTKWIDGICGESVSKKMESPCSGWLFSCCFKELKQRSSLTTCVSFRQCKSTSFNVSGSSAWNTLIQDWGAICSRSPVQILFACHLCVWNLK